MADNLQNRLSKLEVEPPQNLWSAIAKELNEEAVSLRLSSRLQSFEVNPPANNFQAILAALNEKEETIPAPVAAGKLIDFNWRKIAVAASVIALAGTLVFFLFFNNSTTGKQQRVVTSVVKPETPDNELAIVPAPMIIAQTEPVKSPAESVNPTSYIRKASNIYGRSPKRMIASSLSTHDYEDKIEVTAPPITDEWGNPILDRSLLVGDNSSYITVTSPNGEQTRISAKFLDYVSKFYDMTNQNDEWKLRFENWKTIMLREASFTPAPGNFMDLLELKDILIQQ
jgi:hypothetical protein